MTMELYEWQRADVDDLARNGYVGLLAYEPGLGKTYTSIVAGIESGAKRVLIIAPKSTHATAWLPSLATLGIEGRVIGNGKKAEREALFDWEMGYDGWFVCSPQFMVRADREFWTGDLIIADELHQMVTPKSKAQRALSGYHHSDGIPLSQKFPMRIGLTGTPMRQAVMNLWGVMRFLYPDLDERGQIAHSNLFVWASDRLESQEVYTNQRDRWGQPKKVKQFLGEIEPGRLFREAPSVYVHKRRETCCRWHIGGALTVDEPQIIEREVELTPVQKRAIREMSDMMFTYLRDHPLEATIPLTQKQRIRQLTLAEADSESYFGTNADGEEVEKTRIIFPADAKSPVADEIDHILSNLPEREGVVVYTEFQGFAEFLVRYLTARGYRAQEYSGVRKADLSLFGKEYDVLVGVISALGTGTDGLQKVSNTEIWADQPISLTNQSQAHARLERLGGRQVQRYVLLDSEGVQAGRVEDLILTRALVDRTIAVRG